MTGKNNRPLYKNVDHGWAWVIATSGFFIHIVVGGHRRSMGLFFLELLDYYDTSKSEAALVTSIFYVLSLGSAPIATALSNRIPVRFVVASGGLAVSVAFVLAAFVKSMKIAILTMGALSGIGNAFLHIPTLVLVGQHFDQRRTLAVGISLAGGATGAFIFPPLVSLSMELYGFPGMLLSVSGMSLQSVIFAMLLRAPEKIEEEIMEDEGFDAELELLQKSIQVTDDCLNNNENPKYLKNSMEVSSQSDDDAEIMEDGDQPSALKCCRNRSVFRMPSFYLYAMSGAIATEMLPMALYLIPPLCHDVNIGLEQQSLILLTMGVPDLVARLTIGFIADKWPLWRVDMFILLLLIKGFMWLLVTLIPGFISIMVFAQFVGLIGGCIFTLYLPILVDAVGLKNIDKIFSVSLALEGTFCLILPPLLAFVRDATGSWSESYRIMMALSISAAVLVIYDCRLGRTLRRKTSP